MKESRELIPPVEEKEFQTAWVLFREFNLLRWLVSDNVRWFSRSGSPIGYKYPISKLVRVDQAGKRIIGCFLNSSFFENSQ